MWSVFKKELNGFFSSLIAYLSIGVFLLVLSLFIWIFPETAVLDYGYATLVTLFQITPFVFMFLIPAITMRTFAEEKREGTLELLLTLPLNEWQIVWGKFWANSVILLIALLLTVPWVFSVYSLGNPIGNLDTGATLGSYLGLFLIGICYVAIGLFCSALTKNQIVAFTLAVFCSFFAYQGIASLAQLSVMTVKGFSLASIGLQSHYESVSRGVLDTRDVAYFIAVILLFVFLSKNVLGGKRWAL